MTVNYIQAIMTDLLVTEPKENIDVPVPEIASTPFNRSDADIIFRTSDGVEFKLHKQILIMASAILEAIAERADTQRDSATTLVIPAVNVSETYPVFDTLIRYCYPVVGPRPSTLEEIRPVLSAATKYGIQAAIEPLTNLLLGFVDTHPVRVYAIACLNGLEDIARKAARFAARGVSEEEMNFVELELLPADVYWSFLVYYHNSRPENCHLQWRNILITDESFQCSTDVTSISSYFNEDDSSDVIIQSADGVQFHLHKIILSKASPFFRDMFTIPQQNTRKEHDTSIIPVSESSQTLECLFRLTYPFSTDLLFESLDLCLINDVLEAASKYDMQRAFFIMKQRLASYTGQEPVEVFLIACRHRCHEIAKTAAKNAMYKPILPSAGTDMASKETLNPRLNVPATFLHRLIRYRLDYLAIIDAKMDDSNWIAAISNDRRFEIFRRAFEVRCTATSCKVRKPKVKGRTWYIPQWLDEFLGEIKSSIRAGISLGSADEDSMLDKTVGRMLQCEGECRNTADITVLRAFRTMISQQIREAITEVSSL
jgi:hypothetical protein